MECIGKGKAHWPYEFGVKVSVATTLAHARGGQFVTHVKALPGNPNGHTLATVIPDMETLFGNSIERILARQGLSRPQRPARLQVQGVHIRLEAAGNATAQARTAQAFHVEPVIGYLKSEHRMGRSYLSHR